MYTPGFWFTAHGDALGSAGSEHLHYINAHQ